MSEHRTIESLKPHPINERIYGDLFDHELIKSIEDYGFKGSIEITEDGTIISGHRRYNACVELGYETIPVTILDIKDPDEVLVYLIRMNQSQRKRTNEQIACEFEVFKEIEVRRQERVKAEKCRVAANVQHGNGVVENFPPPTDTEESCKSRDKAAKQINADWSGRTAENALKVKKYADNLKEVLPDIANGLLDVLNNKSVNAAVLEMNNIKKQLKQDAIDQERAIRDAAHVAEMAEQLKVEPEIEAEVLPEPETPAPVVETVATPAPKKADPIEFFNPDIPEPEPVKKSKFNSTNENIEWAKWSWNPVTGCLHDCQYCYARDIAVRYNKGDFSPAFHPERLNAPEFTNIPQARIDEPGINNVFVCSMADLFGKWVDASWIQAVIDVCREQSQWTYLMLTKNPERYLEFEFPGNCWLGASATNQKQFNRAINTFKSMSFDEQNEDCIKFLSCEPLNEEIVISKEHINGDDFFETNQLSWVDWIIIGGRSESMRMPAFQPEWKWVEHLIVSANYEDVPIYFKPNLSVRPKEYPES